MSRDDKYLAEGRVSGGFAKACSQRVQVEEQVDGKFRVGGEINVEHVARDVGDSRSQVILSTDAFSWKRGGLS